MGKKEQEALLTKVLSMLSSMSDVTTKEKSDTIGLHKDGVQFGIIKNNSVHLMDQVGAFKQVAEEILADTDKFLRKSTEAYWKASGMK